MKLHCLLTLGLALTAASTLHAAPASAPNAAPNTAPHTAPNAAFTLQDQPGQHLDVLRGGKVVGRYMYAYDKSTPDKRAETYKPYLHIFNPEGTAPITKGLGGQFPHHRGLFVGWNKISFGGKSYDRWHMSGGEQVHQKFLAQQADATQATITSLVHWQDEKGKPIVEEERTLTFRQPPASAYVLVDFTSKMSAPNGDVKLDGDPEHAGVQFRPAAEVEAKQTVYVFPREGAQPTKDTDYAWVGQTFGLNGARYSVVMMSAPSNPKETRWSAYRDYGRFGAFPRATIKQGESATFKYRFLIASGDMPSAEAIQTVANEFTGETAPTPTLTVIPVAKPAAK